jgi:tetratricopeptide (TPR) repeat protein
MELLPTPARPAPDERVLAAALARSLADHPDRRAALAAAVADGDASGRGTRAVGTTLLAVASGLDDRPDEPDVRTDALAETVDGVLGLVDDTDTLSAAVEALSTGSDDLDARLVDATRAFERDLSRVLAGDLDGGPRAGFGDALGGAHDADGLAAAVGLRGALGSRTVVDTLSALLDADFADDVRSTLARTRAALADRLRAVDDPEVGRDSGSGATELQPIRNDPDGPTLSPETAWVRALRGELAAEAGDHTTAHERYATAVESLTAAGEPVAAAVCRVNVAPVYRTLGEHEAALAQYQAANEAFRDPTVRQQRAGAVCVATLGEGALDADQVAQAEGYLRRGREDFAAADDPWGEARCLLALAKTAVRRGDAAEAADLFRTAGDRSDRLGDDRGRAAANLGLATVAGHEAVAVDPETAITDAMTAARRVGDHDSVGAAALRFGELATERGDDDLAVEQFERGLEAFRAADDQTGVATCLHNLGRLAQERGDADAARERFTAARTAAETAGDRYAAARSVDRLGELARADHPERALDRFETAAGTFLELGAVRDALPTLSALVEVAIETGDTDTAREYCETALDVLEQTDRTERRAHFERLRERIDES